jgi:hypothetical protein
MYGTIVGGLIFHKATENAFRCFWLFFIVQLKIFEIVSLSGISLFQKGVKLQGWHFLN